MSYLLHFASETTLMSQTYSRYQFQAPHLTLGVGETKWSDHVRCFGWGQRKTTAWLV